MLVHPSHSDTNDDKRHNKIYDNNNAIAKRMSYGICTNNLSPKLFNPPRSEEKKYIKLLTII